MPNIISRENAEALIRQQVVPEIFQDVPKQSTFMSLARKLPNMTSNQTRIRVLDLLPMAYWVNGDTGFKQTSEQAWDNVFLTAAELAVIVPIPEAVLSDAEIDIMGEDGVFGKVEELVITLDGEYVDIDYRLKSVPFQRIRSITGYLVGTLDRFTNAKLSEVEDRVKHM